MASTFLQDITSLYPAYNDSFIILESTDVIDRLEVTVLNHADTFPTPFLVYPDKEGKLLFNLVDIAKTAFENKRFTRGVGTILNMTQNFSDNLTQLDISYRIYTDAGTETLLRSYNFIKSSLQPWEKTEDHRILSGSEDGQSYNMTYFTGFPFEFSLTRSTNAAVVSVENRPFNYSTVNFDQSAGNCLSLVVDNGLNNWNTTNILPLNNGLNELTIIKDTQPFAELNLTKVPPKKGVYLRWFNNHGGFNYWLFGSDTVTSISGSSIGYTGRNDFNNGINSDSNYIDTGKEATKKIRVNTVVNNSQIKTFESLFISPNIELYTSDMPYVSGKWIGVKVKDSFSNPNKRTNNKISISIEFPEIKTLRL